MVVYLAGFTISIFILYLSDRIIKSNRWVFIALALLVPCLIAGLRANSVGTDVQVYLMQMTEAAITSGSFSEYMQSNWFMLWRYLYVYDYEIGFSLTVYVIARIFKNIFAVKLVLQLLTILPYCVAITKVKDKIPLWFSMFVYYFFMFNVSLNIMRQLIAMAFVFLAFVYIMNGEKYKCVFFTIIAILFHNSAVLSVVIYFIYFFIKNRTFHLRIWGRNRTNFYSNTKIVIATGALLLLCINIIINVISLFVSIRYFDYISGNIRFMPNQLILRLPVLILFAYVWWKYKNSENGTMFCFLFTMLCYDLICAQFTSVNEFAGRIALYFSQFSLITYPFLYVTTKRNKLVLILLVSYQIVYWMYYYVYMGANETVPYILGV